MGKIPDIKDEDSLAAWLEDQPREVSVWIASRAAARVLPLWWQYTRLNDAAQKRNVTVLPVLRCLLASTLASKRVSRGIQSFAASAVSEASAAQHIIGDLNSAHEVVSASKEAANAANKKQFIEAVLGCALSVDRATRDRLFVVPTGFRSGQGFSFIAMDAKEITDGYVPDALPLWPDGPRQLREEWTKIKAQVAASPDAADWRFWLDWYDALLAGRTMLPDPARTWDMLEKIATEIDLEIWDAGPEVVNPKIREIWELHRLRAECAALQAEKDAFLAARASEVQRRHNHPPDGLVDDQPEFARQITIVWDTLDEARDELEQDRPDKTRLRAIAERLGAALNEILLYCGKVADAAVISAAKVGGGAVGTAILDQVANNGRLMQLAKDLLAHASGG